MMYNKYNRVDRTQVINNSSNGGIGLLGALFLLFLTLKLMGIITWPWLWVTAPLWAPFAFIFFIGVGIFVGSLAAGVYHNSKRKK